MSPGYPDGSATSRPSRTRRCFRLDEQALLNALLERVKAVLDADTATVLLLDRAAGELVATAAHGIEEEVDQGVRIPLGPGSRARSRPRRARSS